MRSPSDPVGRAQDPVAFKEIADNYKEAEKIVRKFGGRGPGVIGRDGVMRFTVRGKKFRGVEMAKDMIFCNDCDNSAKCSHFNQCFAERSKKNDDNN